MTTRSLAMCLQQHRSPKTGVEKNAVLVICTPRFDRVYMTIEKRGRWGLPGGKIDRGENAFAAACREFREETGQEFEMHRWTELNKFTHNGTRFYVGCYAARLITGAITNPDIAALEFPRLDSVQRAIESSAPLQCGAYRFEVRRCMIATCRDLLRQN